MKKIFETAIAIASISLISGCASLYSAFGTNSEEVREVAIQKINEYAEKAIEKKIDESENLSDEDKEKLKADIRKLQSEIVLKITEIKKKCEEKKSSTANE